MIRIEGDDFEFSGTSAELVSDIIMVLMHMYWDTKEKSGEKPALAELGAFLLSLFDSSCPLFDGEKGREFHRDMTKALGMMVEVLAERTIKTASDSKRGGWKIH